MNLSDSSLITDETILVFDKDGVLFESEEIKLQVFEELFEEHDESKDEIYRYNRDTVGIPREIKFRHICRSILKLDFSEEDIRNYITRLKEILKDKLANAPLVGGVTEFLYERRNNLKFVCSVAPMAEIESQLVHNNLLEHFEAYFGFPRSKSKGFGLLKSEISESRYTIFGRL